MFHCYILFRLFDHAFFISFFHSKQRADAMVWGASMFLFCPGQFSCFKTKGDVPKLWAEREARGLRCSLSGWSLLTREGLCRDSRLQIGIDDSPQVSQSPAPKTPSSKRPNDKLTTPLCGTDTEDFSWSRRITSSISDKWDQDNKAKHKDWWSPLWASSRACYFYFFFSSSSPWEVRCRTQGSKFSARKATRPCWVEASQHSLHYHIPYSHNVRCCHQQSATVRVSGQIAKLRTPLSLLFFFFFSWLIRPPLQGILPHCHKAWTSQIWSFLFSSLPPPSWLLYFLDGYPTLIGVQSFQWPSME